MLHIICNQLHIDLTQLLATAITVYCKSPHEAVLDNIHLFCTCRLHNQCRTCFYFMLLMLFLFKHKNMFLNVFLVSKSVFYNYVCIIQCGHKTDATIFNCSHVESASVEECQ